MFFKSIWSYTTALILGCGAILLSCQNTSLQVPSIGANPTTQNHPTLPDAPQQTASSAFWKYWGDGKAELSGYKGMTSRYGRLIPAQTVLIFVTEPLHRKTLIKDDSASGSNKISTLKLNHVLKFRTGLYPYSVMTSTFSPVDTWRQRAFDPVKISFTAQEWCGHVFQGVWPGAGYFESQTMSYFASEGERKEKVKTTSDTLYEDALFIQLRSLDQSLFAKGHWKGQLVPSIWHHRKSHTPMRPLEATLQRTTIQKDKKKLHRWTLKTQQFTRTVDMTIEYPHTIVGWSHSNGETFTLQKSTRLPYWNLSKAGDERFLKQLGL